MLGRGFDVHDNGIHEPARDQPLDALRRTATTHGAEAARIPPHERPPGFAPLMVDGDDGCHDWRGSPLATVESARTISAARRSTPRALS